MNYTRVSDIPQPLQDQIARTMPEAFRVYPRRFVEVSLYLNSSDIRNTCRFYFHMNDDAFAEFGLSYDQCIICGLRNFKVPEIHIARKHPEFKSLAQEAFIGTFDMACME